MKILQVDFHLPERDVDVLFLELTIDVAVDLVQHRVAIAQVANMHAQFVVEGAFAEVEEIHVGFRLFEYPWVFSRRLE